MEVVGQVRQELSRVFFLLLRVRLAGAAFLLALAALFAATADAPWKTWVAAGMGALVLAVGLRDLLARAHAPLTIRAIAGHVLLVLAAQLVAITVTGGIQSPIVAVVPVMAMAMAIGTGRAGVYALAMLAPLGFVWLLFALDAAGAAPDLLPPVLRGTGGGYAGVGWTLTMATVLTVIVAGAGSLALFARRAFDRALADAASARAAAIDAMRERNEELTSLSGALAHELKNPLATVQGLAGLLEQRLPDQSREGRHVAVMLGEIKRMGGILDEFLNFSRPARGLAVATVNAAALARDVAQLYAEVAAERAVRLRAAITSRHEVRCDPRKAQQVLVNLLQNALDVARAEVTLAVSDIPDGVRFEVRDDGPGLAPEVRGRLFTVGATTKPDGSGLGLVIARAIAEQHGGALTLSERDDGGCVARFDLPLSGPAAATGADPATTPSSPSRPEDAP